MKYDFAFSWDSTYGYAARLVDAHAERGLVIDLGCGAAAFEQPLTELGFTYQGFEHDPESVALCRTRGIRCAPIDLSDFDRAIEQVLAVVGETPVRVVSMLDVIEHLVEPERVIAGLAKLLDALSLQDDVAAMLVVSVPNVAHFDLGAKLVSGRWDVTDVGLLDNTHVTLFTESRVEEVMAVGGFVEVGRNDVLIGDSEQVVADHPVLERATPLSAYLRDVRDRADANGATYQFVRCYVRAGGSTVRPNATTDARGDGSPAPFCSVLVRAGDDPEALAHTLRDIGAQRDPDVEVVVAVPSDALGDVEQAVAELDMRCPVTLFAPTGPSAATARNEALTVATGRYVTFLDGGQRVGPDWIAEFRVGSFQAPGRTVRAGSSDASPGVPERRTNESFSFVGLLAVDDGAIGSFAAPRTAITALRLRFDETMGQAADWEFAVQLTGRTGVADRPAVTCTRPARVRLTDTERAAVIARLDEAPMLVPAGSASAIAQLFWRSAERDEFEQRVDAYERSRYWRITAPARWLSSRRRRPTP